MPHFYKHKIYVTPKIQNYLKQILHYVPDSNY